MFAIPRSVTQAWIWLERRLQAITDHLSLPNASDLDKILRYEASIQRQLAYAINQLERLQRARKGELLPAPLSVQLTNDR